ncbi:MAG TPA: S41 family peptidase [Vicinamibacterales bacterium]|nr:S41 family peptidase [Vicinamibacterales bacterium]
MRSSRFFPAAVLAVLFSALAGGLFGGSAFATQDEVKQQYRVFTSALAAIEREYVDEVPSDRLVYSAIDGMLKTLDPHSSFFDPRSYRQLRERQEGKYYGLGIQIQVIDGDITVMSIFEGSPAYRKGLRRLDVIARIEGVDAQGRKIMEDAKGWTSDQAVARLKGPKGTTVDISLRRRGYDGLIDLTVERDEVNITTVRGAFMIDRETGYIKLGDFSETSDDEVGAALKSLTAQGMKRLVFDLRDNPGGPLEQAIRVSNRFLPRGQLIVYTRGRVENANQDYRATEESEYTHLPLVVLVNRNSASASEIVSGAIQDHDRGLVVGETTFGKALVQSVYRISGNAGLALTTGRYYTPSGRMIQRPWDGAFDEYLTYSLREQTAEREHSPADLKLTDAGRKVYGGGGIEPDKFVVGPVEGFNPTRFGRILVARQAFANFADQFTAEGDTRLGAANRNKKRIARGFEVTDAMLADFRASLKAQRITLDEEAFAKDEAFIRAMIRYDIDLALFGVEEARRNLIAKDPQAQFALQQFPDAIRLTELSRNRPARGGNER